MNKASAVSNKHNQELEALEGKIEALHNSHAIELCKFKEVLLKTETKAKENMREKDENIATLTEQLQSARAKQIYTNSIIEEEQIRTDKLRVEESQARLQAHINKEKLSLLVNTKNNLIDDLEQATGRVEVLERSLEHSNSKAEMLKAERNLNSAMLIDLQIENKKMLGEISDLKAKANEQEQQYWDLHSKLQANIQMIQNLSASPSSPSARESENRKELEQKEALEQTFRKKIDVLERRNASTNEIIRNLRTYLQNVDHSDHHGDEKNISSREFEFADENRGARGGPRRLPPLREERTRACRFFRSVTAHGTERNGHDTHPL